MTLPPTEITYPARIRASDSDTSSRLLSRNVLVTSLFVIYGYAMEGFPGFYSANQCEQFMMHNHPTGPHDRTVCLNVLAAYLLQQHSCA